MNQGPRSLSYSLLENVVLVCSDVESGSYEFYLFPKDSVGRNETTQEAKRGLGGSVVFVARNRFAILDKSHNQVMIKISEIRSLRSVVFQ
jgi:coatomer protein complex subunit alpha (xenin)